MAAQPLGPRGMEYEASIILNAHEALLRAAEVAFGFLTVAFAGVREQDPKDGKLEGLHLLTCPERDAPGVGMGCLGTLRELSTLAF